MRLEPRQPYTVVEDETADMDQADIDAANGEGYDASDPHEWPDEVYQTARDNWEDGPEAFDRWVDEQ